MGRRQQISGQFESWTAMKGFAERLGNVGVVRGLELLISTLRRHVLWTRSGLESGLY